jgi:WD40 repeat protein
MQLRDQLRQAAKTWDERQRPQDLLWAGSAYLDFLAWRERYPGGLTEIEGAFAAAMTSSATRKKRRRRMAVAAAFAVLLGVLAIVGGFWQRSATEARRAEAANLLSLAQLQLEEHPTATVAFAIRSLELSDSAEMRRLALKALWQGPTEFRIPTASFYTVDFSPDGRWLLTAEGSPQGNSSGLLWPANGGPPTALEPKIGALGEYRFSPVGDLAASYFNSAQELGLWSLPSGRFLRSFSVGGEYNQFFWFTRDGTRIITTTEDLEGDLARVRIRSWPLEGDEPDFLTRLEVPKESGGTFFGLDPTETRVAWVEGKTFNIAPLDRMRTGSAPTVSLEHDGHLGAAVFDDQGQKVATSDSTGKISVWSLGRDPAELVRSIVVDRRDNWCSLRFDRSGTMVCSKEGNLIDLSAPPDAVPLRLLRPKPYGWGQAFEPHNRWFAIGHHEAVSLWPLARQYPLVLRAREDNPTGFLFSPNGDWIASASTEGTVRLLPLRSGSRQVSKILFQAEGAWEGANVLTIAPDGSFLAMGNPNGGVWVLPVDGSQTRRLVAFKDVISEVVVGPESRLVAAGAGGNLREEALVRVWDLESGETRILDAGDGIAISHMLFTNDGDLWVRSEAMLRRWNLHGDRPRIVEEVDLTDPEFAVGELCAFDPDIRRILLEGPASIWLHDLDSQEFREISTHDSCQWFSLQADGEIIISIDAQAGIRVGPVTGEEPHLLLGREGGPVSMSADGQWIASRGPDHTIKLWPMPDLSKPPLHTLPREELIAKLKTLTNLRVVEAPESPSGWKLDIGPFPGWETVPTW